MEQQIIRRQKAMRCFGGALVALAALAMLYAVYHLAVHGLNHIIGGLVMAALVCAPLALGVALLARSYDCEETRRRVVRIALSALFYFYLAALALALFVSRIDFSNYPAQVAFYRANYDLMTNLRPFETVLLYLRALKYNYIGTAIPLSNLFGNVALFMPMAFFLPALFPSLRRVWRFILLMSATLLSVEALQLILCCGSCDVDDVILNLAGTLLVYFLLRIPAVQRALARANLY